MSWKQIVDMSGAEPIGDGWKEATAILSAKDLRANGRRLLAAIGARQDVAIGCTIEIDGKGGKGFLRFRFVEGKWQIAWEFS